jgi:hypothetical protein
VAITTHLLWPLNFYTPDNATGRWRERNGEKAMVVKKTVAAPKTKKAVVKKPVAKVAKKK